MLSKGIVMIYDKRKKISFGGRISHKILFEDTEDIEDVLLTKERIFENPHSVKSQRILAETEGEKNRLLSRIIGRLNSGFRDINLEYLDRFNDDPIEMKSYIIDFESRHERKESGRADPYDHIESWYHGMVSIYDKNAKISYAGRMWSTYQGHKSTLFTVGPEKSGLFGGGGYSNELVNRAGRDRITKGLIDIFNRAGGKTVSAQPNGESHIL